VGCGVEDKMLTQRQLKELLHYNPKTGIFTYYIGKHAGQRAGYVNCANLRKPTPYKFRRIYIKGKHYAMARLAYLYMIGKLPDYPREQMDHINHDSLDDRWINLRCVDQIENGRNQPIPVDNKSGVTGVCWYKPYRKWMAYIGVNNKKITLGYFDDKQNAINARRIAENMYGFHQNHGT
jgi:hypothetical protein